MCSFISRCPVGAGYVSPAWYGVLRIVVHVFFSFPAIRSAPGQVLSPGYNFLGGRRPYLLLFPAARPALGHVPSPGYYFLRVVVLVFVYFPLPGRHWGKIHTRGMVSCGTSFISFLFPAARSALGKFLRPGMMCSWSSSMYSFFSRFPLGTETISPLGYDVLGVVIHVLFFFPLPVRRWTSSPARV